MNKIAIYRLWGGMDFLCLVSYVYLSIIDGRVPVYSDAVSFIEMSEDQGWYTLVFFATAMTLYFSLICSMVLFFKGDKRVRPLVYVQTPFRLILALPSVSFLLWWVPGSSITLVIPLLLLIASEVAKITSLIVCENSHKV
ncbi:MAG: hypothetical protein ACOH2R_01730 [Pseudomonas sp.]